MFFGIYGGDGELKGNKRDCYWIPPPPQCSPYACKEAFHTGDVPHVDGCSVP